MRKCPNCGFQEPPIWRQTLRRLYTEYCHIDDLETWDKELAAQLREKKYVFKDGVKYVLNTVGYIHRIDAFLCAHPEPENPSITEPNKEKHKARILGRKRGQTKLEVSA